MPTVLQGLEERMNSTTAILLFSRTASAEAVAKPLAASNGTARTVAKLLVTHAKQLAKSTQLPFFLFSEKQQIGHTFGERFANAFEAIYQLGFQRVIAIGNDCLTLSKSDILAAATELQSTPLVIGAATDGGAYLVGLDRIAFQKVSFENILWQSEFTCQSIVQFVEKQGLQVKIGVAKSDVDSVADWQKVLRSITSFLRYQLIRLLHTVVNQPALTRNSIINVQYLTSTIAFRAPPHPIQFGH